MAKILCSLSSLLIKGDAMILGLKESLVQLDGATTEIHLRRTMRGTAYCSDWPLKPLEIICLKALKVLT